MLGKIRPSPFDTRPTNVADVLPGGALLLIVNVCSFDGPLTPYTFAARTRTKYVPAGTPVAENAVALLPVFEVAMLLRPDAVPACRMYVVGAHPPAGAFHDICNVDPLTNPPKPLGAFGAFVQPPPEPTTRTASLEGGPLTPPALSARTRM